MSLNLNLNKRYTTEIMVIQNFGTRNEIQHENLTATEAARLVGVSPSRVSEMKQEAYFNNFSRGFKVQKSGHYIHIGLYTKWN